MENRLTVAGRSAELPDKQCLVQAERNQGNLASQHRIDGWFGRLHDHVSYGARQYYEGHATGKSDGCQVCQ